MYLRLENPLPRSKLMRLKIFLLLALFLVAAPAPVAAQVRIVGRVIDDLTQMPLSQARVTLRAPDGSVLARLETSGTGTFESEVRNVRAVRIGVERFGYTPNTSPLLYFDARKFFQVEMRMDPEAILLAPLEVIAWSARPENALHEGFRRRLSSGLGVYITRDQIVARNPNRVSDLLRDVPGLEVVASGYGTRPFVRVARATGIACATQIFVDGFLINKRGFDAGGFGLVDMRIDDVVFPASVEGIEIYRGLGTIPPEFLNPDAECGVIAIWTRRGG